MVFDVFYSDTNDTKKIKFTGNMLSETNQSNGVVDILLHGKLIIRTCE